MENKTDFDRKSKPNRSPNVYMTNYTHVAIPSAAVFVMAALMYRRGKWV